MRKIKIVGDNYFGSWNKTRVACRGIILEGDRLLMSCETVNELWMIPGGGLEEGEDESACCIREVQEETGRIVQLTPCVLEVDEYYEDCRYISKYFFGNVIRTAEARLTEEERLGGLKAGWLPVTEAMEIFSHHADYAEVDEMKRGLYLREYTALRALFRQDPMKIVIAMDSFKGSLSSLEAGEAVRRGVLRALQAGAESDRTAVQRSEDNKGTCKASETALAEIIVKPLADGGEGTTEALASGLHGEFRVADVQDPFGRPRAARYGILPDRRLAVMEMAEASGLTLIAEDRLDPHRANSAGVGQMILDALRTGCRDFIIGIGGSATTEGGIGMLHALGWDFYDELGEELPPVFSSLKRIARIEDKRVPEELLKSHFQIACDVTNPLCGEKGAIAIFGPQKGVRSDEIAGMDREMLHYAEAAERYSGKNCKNEAGAGAAGGLGFAFLNFLPGAELRRGIDIVLDVVGMEEAVQDADLVITGEGRLDAQTAMGKAPAGVAKLAGKYGCRVAALAGVLTEDASACHAAGIDAYFPIIRGITTAEEAMKPETARLNLELAAEEIIRLFQDK